VSNVLHDPDPLPEQDHAHRPRKVLRIVRTGQIASERLDAPRAGTNWNGESTCVPMWSENIRIREANPWQGGRKREAIPAWLANSITTQRG
jgi:hypothetical protein